MNWRNHKLAEKSNRELKKEQKIKEENIQKLDEQIKKSKKIPEEYKKKMNKCLMLNIITLLVMVLYLVSINILSLYLDTDIYLRYLKILSIVFAMIALIYFELSYKKDNEGLFLYGIEILVIGLVTLFANYAYYLFFDRYNRILIGITIIVVVYYIIKILITRKNMEKRYYKEQNDIKEIVKK